MVLLGGTGEARLEDGGWGSGRTGTVDICLSTRQYPPARRVVPWRPEACFSYVVPPLGLLTGHIQGQRELMPPLGRSGMHLLGWAGCWLPSLQKIHPRRTLILVLDVKSQAQLTAQ